MGVSNGVWGAASCAMGSSDLRSELLSPLVVAGFCLPLVGVIGRSELRSELRSESSGPRCAAGRDGGAWESPSISASFFPTAIGAALFKPANGSAPAQLLAASSAARTR